MARRKSAFDRCVEDVEARGTAYDPRAVCAAIGRKKYGQREMTRRAIAGKRRAARGNYDGMGDEPIAYFKQRNDGKYRVEFVYPRSGARITKILTPEKFEEMRSSGKYHVYHSSRDNPYESAAELSEAFHGRPAESVSYVETPLHVHSTLTELGRLVSIELKDGTELEFDADTMLSSNEAGTHLFVDGGDQSVDLGMFPECDGTKEACSLGKAKYITYETAKFHLGRRDKTPGPYRHKFGDESGDLPSLEYDTVNRLLSFVGGHYYIDLDLEGGYSAGIRD
jgi:hypothetical protein